MSFGSVIKSVKKVASNLLGGNSNSYQIPKPKPTPIIKQLPTNYAAPLQTISKAYTAADFARNSQIMNSNSAKMKQNSGVTSQSKKIADANAAKIAAFYAEKERKRQETQKGFDEIKAKLKANQLAKAKEAAWKNGVKKGSTDIKFGADFDGNKEEYEKAYLEALAQFQKQKEAKGNWFSRAIDKVTGRKESGARKFAESKVQEVAGKNVSAYESKLNAFNKDKATRLAAFEAGKLKLSQADLQKAADDYNSWESKQIDQLEKDRARTTAQLEAFNTGSQQKLNAPGAKAAGVVGKFLGGLENNRIWKYTFGSGTESKPSLVTAPSRVVNFLGNLNSKNRDIYQYGGGSVDRSKNGKTAWQATFNQRNFNIRPYTDRPFNKDEAWDLLNGKRDNKNLGAGSIQQSALRSQFAKAKNSKDQMDIAKKFWDEMNRSNRNANSLQEFAADPLNIAGGIGEYAKGAGWLGKFSEVGRANKATSFAFKAADKFSAGKAKIGQTKLVKWLGTEYKSPSEKLGEAISNAKQIQATAQQSIFKRVNQLNKKLAGNERIDVSVFDDFKHLTDSEARTLQRMVDGKLVARDRLILAGRGSKATRAKLEGIATKWQDFAEKMRLADDVNPSRFGKGKKTYSPHTAWLTKKGKNLDDYNFKLKKRWHGTQNADDFYQGTVDRYFKSSLDDAHVAESGVKRSRQIAEREKLLKIYDDAIVPARAEVEKAYKKTRTPFNRARGVIEAPGRLWKKSVLKYRPAWTVNNVLYNTQAGVLSGGAGSLAEQAKMLRPKYWRKAMDESRGAFGGNLGKEIGKGRLNKFYNGVEDWSRVAAGRSAMKKGLTEEQAVKRVNRYLFDYKTKNWEKPLKTVVPFWSFQKNLAKAAISMPFDRPTAALAYNRFDKFQQNQFDQDFNKTVKQLKDAGYTDDEIESFRKEKAKQYGGKLKVGKNYINTPFNAFSDKGLSSMGVNPWLASAGEYANAEDHFGMPLKGKNASFASRVIKKFPQADLVQEGYRSAKQKLVKAKRVEKWIGKKGSEGYGLTKEKQGYDPSKANYVRSLDEGAKLKQNLLAFGGVPRSTQFDKGKFVKGKVLQKATGEYFSLNTKNMEYKDAEALRQGVFKKYGITPDEFYKGILAKYDSDNTKSIKNLKEQAATANKSLFEEYSKQPYGSKNEWAVKKLRELTASGYFDKNPFLKSFDWIGENAIAKADKSRLTKKAIATGDWSEWRKRYGGSTSGKSAAYKKAKSSGDWSAYIAKYGDTRKKSKFQSDGKYFKSAESMQKYKDGTFWRKYATADSAARKQLLKDNPQYNKRANWTDAQWDAQKIIDRAKRVSKARGFGNFAELMDEAKAKATVSAFKFTSSRKGRTKKIVYSK